MNSKLINIESVKDNSKEFIIKDCSGISLGRIFVLELDKTNKNITVRFKFYKKVEDYYDHLLESIEVLIKEFLLKRELFKINLIVNEDFDFSPIIEKGFELEGILKDNICKGVMDYKSEFLF